MRSILLLWLCTAMAQAQNPVSELTMNMGQKVLNRERSLDKTSSVVFSPLSMAVGLGMLHQGANGRTKTDLSSALGLSPDDATFKEDFKNALPEESEYTSLSSLITVAADAQVRGDYGQAIEETFHGQPFQHNFTAKAGFAIHSINQWVRTRSKGKVQQLLPKGSVTKDTRIVLVNVLTYQANWHNSLFSTLPDPLNFTTSDGTVIEDVEAMFAETEMAFKKIGQNSVIGLPLKDEDTYLVVVYPDEQIGVDGALHSLAIDPALFDAILSPENLPTPRVTLTMPKLKLRKRFRMKNVLQDIYPKSSIVFDAGRADFSRMARKPQGIAVQEIHHVAVMYVNEDGVDASAATGVAIAPYAFFPPETNIEINRPFITFLVNAKTKVVLFAASVEDPMQ